MGNTHSWIYFALGTMMLWGIWGVLLKFVSTKYSWTQIYVSSNIALIIMVTIVAIIYKPNVFASKTVFLLALFAGFAGTTGYILMVKAFEKGPASLVVALTALYPAVTTILSYIFLGEKLGLQKITGVILAVIAILLLSR